MDTFRFVRWPLASVRQIVHPLLILSLAASVFSSTGHRPYAAPGAVTTPAAQSSRLAWYRGNTHTHTSNSDGDSSPAEVASWYKDHGYDFVVITDHNKLTDVVNLNATLGLPGRFLVMGGEELTDSFGGKPVHLNGLNLAGVVQPQHGSDVVSTLENDLAAIRQAGGLPYINHPNYGWAITADDLKKVTGSALLEIYNAHPVVNNVGDATHPAVEAIWDEVLSYGKLMYGVAADDEHTLSKSGGALPGRAWVMVRAASLDPEALTQAMQRGDFYASTGVMLQEYQVSPAGLSLTVESGVSGATTIDFIGKNGRLLQRSTTGTAVYKFTGDEMYVRAKIVNASGQAAWTQPVYTARLNPAGAVLNGASFGSEPGALKAVAPDSIAVVSGAGLAGEPVQVERQADGSFPTSLGGTTVTVNGRLAALYYVSPTQVNFHVPAETELGAGEVVVTNAAGTTTRYPVRVTSVSPGIFTEDGTGRGNAFVIDVRTLLCRAFLPDDQTRRFQLYITGARGAAQLQVKVNGQPVIIEAIKPRGRLPGLDQINIAIASALPPGTATLVIQADGVESNTTTMRLY